MKKMILALVVFIAIMGAPKMALAENVEKARPDRVTEIQVARMQALYTTILHKETNYKLIKQRITWNDDCSEFRWYLLAYNGDLQTEENATLYVHKDEVAQLERALLLTYCL